MLTQRFFPVKTKVGAGKLVLDTNFVHCMVGSLGWIEGVECFFHFCKMGW